jgi:hypothetical protein
MAPSPPHNSFDAFLAASPRVQRTGMRALLALSRRASGRRLIARLPSAGQLAQVLEGLRRYDDPDLARSLGWDAEAVVERGRDLRRREGRP